MGKKLIRILIIFLVCACLDWDVSQAQESAQEILKKIETLSKEAQNCTDMGRMQKLMKELNQLGQAYTKALQDEASQNSQTTKTASPGGKIPNMQEEKARQDALHAELKHQQEEPCYPVIYQKAYAKKYVGSDLPWVTCVPLQFQLTWDVEERWVRTDKFPTGIVKYKVAENYPGYLKLIYDQKTRKVLESFNIQGPSPQKNERITIQAQSASANGLLAEAYGIPNEYKTVTAPGLPYFQIEPKSDGGTFFVYDSMTGEIKGEIGMCLTIDTINNKIVKAPFHLCYNVPQGVGRIETQYIEGITPEVLSKALKDGKLKRSVPFEYKMDYTRVNLPELYTQKGICELDITFNPKAVLSVKPSEDFQSEGPDENDHFAPKSKVYILKNSGNVPIDVTIEKTADWLSLSHTSEKIPSNAKLNITISIDEVKASSLKEGTYKDKVKFLNVTNGSGNTSRNVTLKVEEKQIWQVKLMGQYKRDVRNVREILEPGATKSKSINDIRTVKFDYNLSGKFTLKKKNKKWIYDGGQVTASKIDYDYSQVPKNLWKINNIKCLHCKDINNLKGRSMSGLVSDQNVFLYWPVVRPALEVDVELNTKLWKNPKDPGSGSKNLKSGTAYYNDDVFLSNTHGHLLPLKNGPYSPQALDKKTDLYHQTVTYQYVLKRLK